MRIRSKSLFIVLMFIAAIVHGQKSALEVNVQNDIFNLFNQTDRYFTNGVDLQFHHMKFNQSPVNCILVGYKRGDVQITGVTLKQHIYTPIDIYTDALQVGDRPYASTLIVGQQLVTVNPVKKYRITSEVSLGLMGQYSGGQALQNFIHGLTPYSENANGWHNQLSHAFLIQYNLGIEKGIINSRHLQLNAIGETQLGTKLTQATSGIDLHLGLFNGFFENPLAYAGTKNITARIYGGIYFDYMFYDATLQGGLFAAENDYYIPPSELNRQRLRTDFGIQLALKSVSLEFGRMSQTAEFINAGNHAWGYLKFTYIIK